jgi:hypothetical protein
MENEIIDLMENTNYYEDLYDIPWTIMRDYAPIKNNKLRIALINIPCGGFGDIIVCQTFSEYLQQWYPMHEIIICTTSIHKFKSLGIDTRKFIEISVHGNDECEGYDKLYFKKIPKSFDIMISIPIIDVQFDINKFKKFIPYANLFNTYTVSEYNGVAPPYTFPIGVGKGQIGIFLTKPTMKSHNLIKKPYGLVYIADRSNPAGIHCRLCFISYMEMIGKKYSKQYPVFQVVVPPWIVKLLVDSTDFKYKFKKKISTYYPNVWIVNSEGKDEFFEGTGNSLIIRGDILPQPRPVFISLIKNSVEDVLLTGDQSITDGLSCCSDKKKIWYQIAPWKQDFANELSKAIPDSTIDNFKTSCGVLRGIHKQKNYTSLLNNYDFRKLGKERMNSLITFHQNKHLPIIQDFMIIILHSRTIESAIKKFKIKYKI